ncbi:MAG: hypothetical protein KA248_01940 [Kiritimatiellae bacterium]|nr:hypothetical protein [Kiritimatiellia bacterium]
MEGFFETAALGRNRSSDPPKSARREAFSIAGGSASLFDAVVDGTVERLRGIFGPLPFGFGSLTVRDGGNPVPCALLLVEMARLACSFRFLRRSFKRDIPGRDMAAEIGRIRARWKELRNRSAEDGD